MNFKGKEKKTGAWVYGCGIVPYGDVTYIINTPETNIVHTVDPETVCVGTQIMDAAGREVFENDIIMIRFGNDEYYYVVKYDKRCGQYYLLNSNVRFDTINDLSVELKFYVVGNVYSNDELLNQALKRNEN